MNLMADSSLFSIPMQMHRCASSYDVGQQQKNGEHHAIIGISLNNETYLSRAATRGDLPLLRG